MNQHIITYLPLILSTIAILVSVASIRAHNKGVVFEKRLQIYCEAEKLYMKGSKIIETCMCKADNEQRVLLGNILFEINSPVKRLIEEATALQDNSLDSPEYRDLVVRFAEIYTQRYAESSAIDNVSVFFSEEIANSITGLYCQIELMRMGILLYEKDFIPLWIESLNQIIIDIDEREILRKMKKKLPL